MSEAALQRARAVLAVAAPLADLERIAALSERLKATGFRWVALEPPGAGA